MIGITGTVWYRSHASATCAMLRPTCSETAFTAEMIRVACCSSGRNSFIPSLLILWLSEMPSADSNAISRPRLDFQPACEQELLSIMRTCAEPGHCVPCKPHRPQAHAYI